MNTFWGMKILRIFFWGSSQNWTIFRAISMHLGSFLKVNVQIGGYFLGLVKFQIFFWGA